MVDSLPGNPAWGIIIQDLETHRKLVDDNWHKVDDPLKLQDFRVTKFAVDQLLQTVETYKTDLMTAKAELAKMDNPDKEVFKDYDGETKIEK